MELMLAIIVGLFGGGGIVAFLKTRSDNKKTEAEAEVTLGGGWQVLWDTARKEINEVRERLAVVEKSEAKCKARLAILEAKSGDEEALKSLIDAEIVKRGGGISGHGKI